MIDLRGQDVRIAAVPWENILLEPQIDWTRSVTSESVDSIDHLLQLLIH